MDFEVWKSAYIAEVTSFPGSFFSSHFFLFSQTQSELTQAPTAVTPDQKRSLSSQPQLTGAPIISLGEGILLGPVPASSDLRGENQPTRITPALLSGIQMAPP